MHWQAPKNIQVERLRDFCRQKYENLPPYLNKMPAARRAPVVVDFFSLPILRGVVKYIISDSVIKIPTLASLNTPCVPLQKK
jgi:hypothetical protein